MASNYASFTLIGIGKSSLCYNGPCVEQAARLVRNMCCPLNLSLAFSVIKCICCQMNSETPCLPILLQNYGSFKALFEVLMNSLLFQKKLRASSMCLQISYMMIIK